MGIVTQHRRRDGDRRVLLRHRLLRYKGKCAHLHGHNGRIEIELASDSLNEQSMVADFSDISRIVKEWIDQNLDHRLLLHRDDRWSPVLRNTTSRSS